MRGLLAVLTEAIDLLREILESFWWGFPLDWDEQCQEAVAETGEDG